MGVGPLDGLARAVFLDRDGVLNRALVRDGRPFAPRTLAELEIPPEVPPALERLRRAGFVLVGVTNQPDVARGTLAASAADALDAAVREVTGITELLVCRHDDADNCECRKPKPGLIFQAAARLRIALEGSYLVGDRWRDVEAGKNAGLRTAFIDYGYRERRPEEADATVASLTEAVDWIEAEVTQERRRAAESA